jgi:hypothetical protein
MTAIAAIIAIEATIVEMDPIMGLIATDSIATIEQIPKNYALFARD